MVALKFIFNFFLIIIIILSSKRTLSYFYSIKIRTDFSYITAPWKNSPTINILLHVHIECAPPNIKQVYWYERVFRQRLAPVFLCVISIVSVKNFDRYTNVLKYEDFISPFARVFWYRRQASVCPGKVNLCCGYVERRAFEHFTKPPFVTHPFLVVYACGYSFKRKFSCFSSSRFLMILWLWASKMTVLTQWWW